MQKYVVIVSKISVALTTVTFVLSIIVHLPILHFSAGVFAGIAAVTYALADTTGLGAYVNTTIPILAMGFAALAVFEMHLFFGK